MRTPVIDPYAAGIVRRIFEMRAAGVKPIQIATTLNEEGVLTLFDYYYKRIGKPNPYNHSHLWSGRNLENILKNPVYIGTLAQLRTTTVSYKNHIVFLQFKQSFLYYTTETRKSQSVNLLQTKIRCNIPPFVL